jgi:hypothetical protein
LGLGLAKLQLYFQYLSHLCIIQTLSRAAAMYCPGSLLHCL